MTDAERLAWFNGDKDAFELYSMIVTVAHRWDDLIDRDKELTDKDINDLMAILLISFPTNRFFRNHQDVLQPLIITSVISYIASSKLEHSTSAHHMELAHVLRYSVHQIAIMMMAITSGFSGAVDNLINAAEVMMPERLDEFYKEHANVKE